MSDRYLTIRNKLHGDVGKEITAALPNFLKVHKARFMRVALNALSDDRLLRCSQTSIISSLMESAQLGMECDGVLGQGYLIPYGNECTFQLGYRGLMQLVRRSDQVKKIKAVCVHEGDVFQWDEGSDQLVHQPSLDQDRFKRAVTHVYAKAVLSSGEIEAIVWSRDQIDAHKQQYAKAWQKRDSAWSTNWPAMARKTLLIQLAKILPVQAESERAIIHDEIRSSVSVGAPLPEAKQLDAVLDTASDTTKMKELDAHFDKDAVVDSAPLFINPEPTPTANEVEQPVQPVQPVEPVDKPHPPWQDRGEATYLNEQVEKYPALKDLRKRVMRLKTPDKIKEICQSWVADGTLTEEERNTVTRMEMYRLRQLRERENQQKTLL